MMRRFREHDIRHVTPLNGDWELYVPPEGTEIEPESWGSGTRRALPVPGVWEMLAGLENYRGQAVARRHVEMPSRGAARLVFGGVSHTARVFVDGSEVGDHHNAYTPFTIDLPELAAGRHELLVHISNEHGELSALHVPNDYYNYGGINRPVELHCLTAPVCLHRLHLTPRERDGQWSAEVRMVVRNLGDACSGDIHVEVAGGELIFANAALPPGDTEFRDTLTPAEIEPWHPNHPVLYDVVATLYLDGEAADDLRDRVGFRTVDTLHHEIRLNGAPIRLWGCNRHEDHPDCGCALTPGVMEQDVRILRDLGANAVRTSHYPNAQYFLDLCDEAGLLVWEEAHARGLDIEAMEHPRFDEQSAACIDEMIGAHYNHPCIVLWGILNECDSTCPAGRAKHARQFEQIRSLDASRPTTYAANKYRTDICQDLPDVCGWNWYFNWYGQRRVVDGLEEQLEWLATTAAAGKPIIVSEFGAGGIPGCRDPRRRAKWSEERQAELLDEDLAAYLNHPRLVGAFVWQFCDVRVDEEWAPRRPRCYNNKGVVDEYRRPKLAYDTVQQHFHAHRRRNIG